LAGKSLTATLTLAISFCYHAEVTEITFVFCFRKSRYA